MRVFGVDCGTEFTGYGVVETLRLRARAEALLALLRRHPSEQEGPHARAARTGLCRAYRAAALWQPEVVAIEEVFFSANAKSALKLGQVRGVAMLAAANCGLPVAEYAPLTIKSSVVGYGLAAKEQVGFMVARLLELGRATPARRRRRRAGHRDLPHPPRADGGAVAAMML
jgi:crossover junction endodeoxyribonuclease RuvC